MSDNRTKLNANQRITSAFTENIDSAAHSRSNESSAQSKPASNNSGYGLVYGKDARARRSTT